MTDVDRPRNLTGHHPQGGGFHHQGVAHGDSLPADPPGGGRLGHSTPAAALRYQHQALDADEALADRLSKLASDG